MYQIRDWLFVSNHNDTNNDYALKRHQIGAMLQLAVHHPNRDIPTLYYPIEDGIALTPFVIRMGLKFVRKHHMEARKILIACRAGACRSVVFAIGTLVEIEKLSIAEAYSTVKSKHRDARPFYLPLASVAAYFGETLTEEDYHWIRLKFETHEKRHIAAPLR